MENMDRETSLEKLIGRIEPADKAMEQACWDHWDNLCKPLRGFGRLEEWVVRMGAAQRTDAPHAGKRAVVIMGADNGVVAEGVSQTGSEVTRQVLENMGDYKSSVCVMSRLLDAEVIPVNIGMNTDAVHPRVRNMAVMHGTGNIMREPAMTAETCRQAILAGAGMVEELVKDGYDLIVTGEMGIGNTTTSAACAAVLFDCDPIEVTGRGAGLSTEGLHHKTEVVRQAIVVNQPDPEDPLDILAKVGGLDIAGLVGCYLGAAACHTPILIDGVISGIAAVIAVRLCPAAKDYMIATHATKEPAGEMIAGELHLAPVLYADMHLGEGTGAAACLSLLDQALNAYDNLPGFDAGHVKKYEHLK